MAPAADNQLPRCAMRSFADHPSPIRLSVGEVRHVHSRPEFDPRTVLVVAEATAPERLIGFSRVDRYDDYNRLGSLARFGAFSGRAHPLRRSTRAPIDCRAGRELNASGWLIL